MERRTLLGLLGNFGLEHLSNVEPFKLQSNAGLTQLGVSQSGTGIIFEAIAAPRMPHRLLVGGITGLEGGVFELRKYQSRNLRHLLARIFPRYGIRPVLTLEEPGLTYLIPFEDLTAREKAWRMFNADPEWPSDAGPIEISLYRQPASLEMSL
jgi:hypothetical protein